ncbi:MAG: hypothetical protein ACOH1T_01290 [Microbacteriaceae bacterium]
MASIRKTVENLFDQIDSMPFGAEERALVDEAIRIADEAGNEPLAYRGRLRLTSSAHMGGDTDAMLASFGWCVAKHMSDPRKFPAIDGNHDLLWHFKWMAGTLSASPLFPREDIATALDEMEKFYQQAGVGMSGVHQARFTEALDNGRLDDAARARELLTTTPRDAYSHCEACVRSNDASYLDTIGNRDAAIATFEEIFDGDLTCGDEPEFSLSRVLLPYLRAGELDKAKAAHLRGYRMARGNDSNIGMIANHLTFCAITGNEARGLAMLERHIGWLALDGLNASGHFTALGAFALLLDAVDRTGHGDAIVRGADETRLRPFFGDHEGPWSVADLASASWRAAEKLAARFDERNGNDYHASEIARLRAVATEHYDVPIEGEGFVVLPPLADEPDPADAPGWLLRAHERSVAEDTIGAVDAARAGLAVATSDDESTSLVLRNRLVRDLVELDRTDEALTELAARVAALRSAGHDHRAAVEEKLGLMLLGVSLENSDPTERLEGALDGETDAELIGSLHLALARTLLRTDRLDEAVPHLEQAAAAFREDSPVRADDAQLVLAYALLNLDRLADTSATVDALLDRSPHRATTARALHARAQARYRLDDNEGAASDAEAELALWMALRGTDGVINACTLSSAILMDLGRPDDAVARFRLALHQASLVDGADLIGLRFGLGRLLVQSGRNEEAAELLLDVYASESEHDAPPAAQAETLVWLGHARRGVGEDGEAYGAWTRSIDLFDQSDDHGASVRTRVLLAQLLAEFNDEDALEVLDEAVTRARALDGDPRPLVDALHLLGRVQCQFRQEDGLATLDEAVAIAQHWEAAWLIADITDSRARSLPFFERVSEAVAVSLSAADLYEAAGDVRSSGFALLFAGQQLLATDDAAGAVGILETSLDRIHDSGPRTAANLALGDALEKLGRLDEAAAARSAAEQG